MKNHESYVTDEDINYRLEISKGHSEVSSFDINENKNIVFERSI